MTATHSGHVSAPYLDRTGAMLADVKRRSYGLLELGNGATTLEIGCGSGVDTSAIASLRPDVRVVGVDSDAAMIAAAEARAATTAVSSRVTHVIARAERLPLRKATFDAVRAERLLQHVADPSAVVAEAVRVTKPGGRVVLVDTDWGSFSVDHPDVHAERTIQRSAAELMLANGYIGRQLYRLLNDQNLHGVCAHVTALFVNDYYVARELARMECAEQHAQDSGLIDHQRHNPMLAIRGSTDLREKMAPQAGFEPATLRLTGGKRSVSRPLRPCVGCRRIVRHPPKIQRFFELRFVSALAPVCRSLLHPKGKKRATSRS